MPATRTACQRVIPAQLIWPNGYTCTGSVWLRYTATDAAAILMTVSATRGTSDPQSQDWCLARDLLTRAFAQNGTAGSGDVILERVGSRALRIALQSPDGAVDLLAPLTEVAAFLAQTYMVCRPGPTEDTRLSEQIDAALVRIMAGAE